MASATGMWQADGGLWIPAQGASATRFRSYHRSARAECAGLSVRLIVGATPFSFFQNNLLCHTLLAGGYLLFLLFFFFSTLALSGSTYLLRSPGRMEEALRALGLNATAAAGGPISVHITPYLFLYRSASYFVFRTTWVGRYLLRT